MSGVLELLAALLTMTGYIVGLYALISHRSKQIARVQIARVQTARVQAEERR